MEAVTDLVKLTVSKQQVRLVPGSSTQFEAANAIDEREFEVTVVNTSDRFASFQIQLTSSQAQLQPEGIDTDENDQWYTVEPEICAKKPPGDRTTFRVVIVKSPLPVYDSKLQLQIRVLSAEFSSLNAVASITLDIGRSGKSLRLYLPQENLSIYPGDRLNIPVLIYNLSPKFAHVRLSLTGLDENWFLEGTAKTVEIPPGDSQDVIFYCSPPKTPHILSQVYDFQVEAEDQGRSTAEEAGTLEVSPYGFVEWGCRQKMLTISHRHRLRQQQQGAQFTFFLRNLSNLAQRIDLRIVDLRNDQQQDAEASTITLPSSQEGETTWSVFHPRRWLGRIQHIQYEVTPTLTHPNSGEPSAPVHIQPKPSSQVVEVQILPIVPLWLQLGGGLLALLLLILLWWNNPRRFHTAPVTAVRIIGNETTVLSGSRDQSIQRWNVNPFALGVEGRRLRHQQVLTDALPHAVRVIRESPFREGRIAIGLDTGAIVLWEVSPPRQVENFRFDGSDRIFDLDFTKDGRYVFGGHGSGNVRQWDLTSGGDSSTPFKQVSIDSVSALSVIDPIVLDSSRRNDDYLLAIGGQYNQLSFWDWEQDVLFQADYQYINESDENQAAIAPVSGPYQYMNSIAVNTNNTVMATADNRGYITLWNIQKLRQCIQTQANRANLSGRQGSSRTLTQALNCNWTDEIYTDQWQVPGLAHQSIRSLALSDNGCYLTGVGDTGQVFLWMLNRDGERSPQFPDAQILANFPNTSLSSVDINQPDEHYLYIASDAPNHQVRLYRYPVPVDNPCSSSSPAHLVNVESSESL